MATSSQATTASGCSEEDIPSRISVTTPVVVAWNKGHTKLDLQLHHDCSNDTAFLKLRASIVLKDSRKTYIYLFLDPDRIKSLELDEALEPDSIPLITGKTLGSPFSCLRFECSSPPDLIGPSKGGLTPKNKSAGVVLDQLRVLAQSTSFSIFISHRSISKPQLQLLCKGINEKVLGTHPGQLDLATLYQGNGGVKVEVPKVTASEDVSGPSYAPKNAKHKAVEQERGDVSPKTSRDTPPSGDLPPSYDEEPSPPPLAVTTTTPSSDPGPSTKKRRRDSAGTAVATGLSPQLLTAMEAICRKVVREEVGEQIQALESRLTARIYEVVNRQADLQSDQFLEETQEVRGEVDGKIEDEFLGLRVQLENFVREEVADAEERIVEHLQNSATVHLAFD